MALRKCWTLGARLDKNRLASVEHQGRVKEFGWNLGLLQVHQPEQLPRASRVSQMLQALKTRKDEREPVAAP